MIVCLFWAMRPHVQILTVFINNLKKKTVQTLHAAHYTESIFNSGGLTGSENMYLSLNSIHSSTLFICELSSASWDSSQLLCLLHMD